MKRILVVAVLAVMAFGLWASTARAGGARCIARADEALDAVTLQQAPELAKIGRRVVAVAGRCEDYGLEPDAEVRIPEQDGQDRPDLQDGEDIAAASWGLAKIRSPEANAAGYRGQGAIACVIDTGLNDGPEFTGRVIGGRDWTDKGAWTDGHGHGTHVSGTVLATHYGVAPEARLLVAKALADSGSGNLSSVESAIIWCADQGASAENMSLGGTYESGSLADAVAYARARGVVVAAAAGNDAARQANYPGATAGVLGVIATDQGDYKASFSNYGPWYDLSAPGDGICSVGGCWSGTSMATPHVAGVAALLAGAGVRGQAAEARILAAAVDLGTPGQDETFGAGRLDALAAVQGAQPGPTATMAPKTATPRPTPGNTGEAQEVIRLVNEERARNGLPALREDARLDAAAKAHSDDMAYNGFMDHTGSDGSDPGERIARAGYHATGWGETIAGGYQSAQEVVTAWMASYGHRAILLGNFADIGVGFAANGTYYPTTWTADVANGDGGAPAPPPPTQTPAPTITRTPVRTATPRATSTPAPTITPRPATPTRIYMPTVTATPASTCGEVSIRGLSVSQASAIQSQLRQAGIAAAYGLAPSGWYVRVPPNARVTCK